MPTFPHVNHKILIFDEYEKAKKRVDVCWDRESFTIRLVSDLPDWIKCSPSRMARKCHRIMVNTEPNLKLTNDPVTLRFHLERGSRKKETFNVDVKVQFDVIDEIDALKCPVCVCQFSDVLQKKKPLIMPCGHTICDECLQTLNKIGSGKSMQPHCPTCRHCILAPTVDGRLQCPVNYSLISLIGERREKQRRRKAAGEKSPSIRSCGHPMTGRCAECDEEMFEEIVFLFSTLARGSRRSR